MTISETTQIAAIVPVELADDLKRLAQQAERSQAAEIRLAVKAWVEAANERESDQT